jgi:hypothetical protein
MATAAREDPIMIETRRAPTTVVASFKGAASRTKVSPADIDRVLRATGGTSGDVAFRRAAMSWVVGTLLGGRHLTGDGGAVAATVLSLMFLDPEVGDRMATYARKGGLLLDYEILGSPTAIRGWYAAVVDFAADDDDGLEFTAGGSF